LRAMALIQEAQDEHCTQLQNEMKSVKEAMKPNERHFAQPQNLVKTIRWGTNTLLSYRIRVV
jgi:hypothetical protein